MERLAKEILVNKLYLKKILFDFDLIMIKKLISKVISSFN